MNDKIVSSARELIGVYGASLIDDPERLGQLLEDKCGEYKYEIFLLCFAMREVSKKGAYPSVDDLIRHRGEHEQTFRANLGFSRHDARVAVDSIADILEDAERAEAAARENENQVVARKGFLNKVYGGIAKRPRTAPVRKKTLRNGLLLLAIVLVFLALYVRTTENRFLAAGAHKILYVAHLSGGDAASGHVRLKAVQLAADMINASGGVKGQMLRIVVQDVTPASAADAVKSHLRDRSITAVITSCGMEVSEALADIGDDHEVPVVIAESSAESATMIGTRPRLYAFRLNIDNGYKGSIASYFVRNGLKRSRAAILSPTIEGESAEIRAAFEEGFESGGGEVVYTSGYSRRGGLDDASAAELLSSGADVAFITDTEPVFGDVIAKMRGAGFEGPIIATCYSGKMIAKAGSALDNCWWILPSYPGDAELMSFQTSYRDNYNESVGADDFIGTILAHDAVRWTADALSRAPGMQGEALRHSFLSTRNLGLTHGTLTIDPRTHGPWNKSMSLLYTSEGKTKFQRRFRPR